MPWYKRESRFTKEELLQILEEGESATPVESREDLLTALMPKGVHFWASASATTYHPVPHFPDADLTGWQVLKPSKDTWKRELDPATSG